MCTLPLEEGAAMSSGHPVDPGSLDPDFAKFREKKLTDKHPRPAPAPPPPKPHAPPRQGEVGRADPEFAKFREKKLTEQAADEIAKNEKLHFGTAPWEKKKEEDENAHRRMKLSDLNLPGKDDRPEGAPAQVGETFKLIDIALGQAPPVGPPAKPPAKPPARPAPAGGRPGAPPPRPPAKPGVAPPGRPAGNRPPAARPAGPPGKQPPRPAAPPPRAGGPSLPAHKRPLGPPKGGAPAPPPPALEGFMDRFDDAAAAAPAAEVHGFEDTSFVEASEAADPYELKDDGSPGVEFRDDDAPRPPARGGPPKPPPPRPGNAPPGKKPPPRV
jgi:hypothetical protein